MKRASSSLSIIGSGIVGLMVAYRAHRDGLHRDIAIFDEGPDPRTQSGSRHRFGATFSGMDARHISLTETGPWTSSHRTELIARPAVDGGWNCLAWSTMSTSEHAWLREFQEIASSPSVHSANTDLVMELNRAGLCEWARLRDELPEIFVPTSDLGLMPIVCANAEDLDGEHSAEFALDPTRVTASVLDVGPEVEGLRPKLDDGTLYGSFMVAGTAYNVLNLCTKLIGWLEAIGVRFHWDTRIDLDSGSLRSTPDGDVVFAAGVSTSTTDLLAKADVLLQGVVGYWTLIPNSGFDHPFKVLGEEPVNFINATPNDGILILSGGYGWIGERSYDEALVLSRPIAYAFERDVARFFFSSDLAPLIAVSAMCIRPALPSGVPMIGDLGLDIPGHRLLVCIGHAAGGFTQSPEAARRILELLHS